ncbi:uncharacterized protein LOC105799350 isoform X2 [Gossypium raimondii]|uniref:uncharacterized protein LOC105799350 isoform X2 n=1 Tax=Gossypium raimondii TaxID=29730 RepID=UPI00063AAEF6|nr:uncharacterized protein LOC105799350 isoform X2 [Gossypium raimondii]
MDSISRLAVVIDNGTGRLERTSITCGRKEIQLALDKRHSILIEFRYNMQRQSQIVSPKMMEAFFPEERRRSKKKKDSFAKPQDSIARTDSGSQAFNVPQLGSKTVSRCLNSSLKLLMSSCSFLLFNCFHNDMRLSV